MAMELNQLLEQIERLRHDLHVLMDEKALTDPEVVAASQMLDVVLNEYQRVLTRNNRKE